MTSVARVLIVDDDEGIRTSLSRILRARGYIVEAAANGPSAVAIAHKSKPELAILDIRMPVMDGIDALRAIRRVSPATLAIFMTAYASSGRSDDALSDGGLAVLSKPLELNALCELVGRSLEPPAVLIVDDDPAICETLVRVLKANQVPAVSAHSLEAARRIIRRSPSSIVVSDIELADGLAFELMDELRVDDKQMPLILFSGKSKWTDPNSDLVPAECEARLTKPINIDVLLEHVRRLARRPDSSETNAIGCDS